MKKLYSALAIGSMLVAMATPVFAYERNPRSQGSSTTNAATIDSTIVTTANTGDNTQGNSVEGLLPNVSSFSVFHRDNRGGSEIKVSGNNVLTTGVAKALTDSTIVANSTNCGCTTQPLLTSRHSSNSSSSVRNMATVTSAIQTEANTGYNMQGNYVGGAAGGEITVGGNNTTTTGDATSTTHNMIVVNSQWSM